MRGINLVLSLLLIALTINPAAAEKPLPLPLPTAVQLDQARAIIADKTIGDDDPRKVASIAVLKRLEKSLVDMLVCSLPDEPDNATVCIAGWFDDQISDAKVAACCSAVSTENNERARCKATLEALQAEKALERAYKNRAGALADLGKAPTKTSHCLANNLDKTCCAAIGAQFEALVCKAAIEITKDAQAMATSDYKTCE